MTPTDNERGVWAWHRKSAHERFSILLLNEYRGLEELGMIATTTPTDGIPQKFLDLAREHDHHEDSDWEV